MICYHALQYKNKTPNSMYAVHMYSVSDLYLIVKAFQVFPFCQELHIMLVYVCTHVYVIQCFDNMMYTNTWNCLLYQHNYYGNCSYKSRHTCVESFQLIFFSIQILPSTHSPNTCKSYYWVMSQLSHNIRNHEFLRLVSYLCI